MAGGNDESIGCQASNGVNGLNGLCFSNPFGSRPVPLLPLPNIKDDGLFRLTVQILILHMYTYYVLLSHCPK
jgi:hypothetical protein